VSAGHLFWLSPYDYHMPDDAVQVRNLDLGTRVEVWSEYVIQGSYLLVGVDDTNIYLEETDQSIARGTVVGDVPVPFVPDTQVAYVSVGPTALWLVHTADDAREWFASMSKLDGTITHVALRPAGLTDRPQEGSTVVWVATGEPDGTRWSLSAIAKGGGEPVMAFDIPTPPSDPPRDGAPPLWVADGDRAWVFAHDSLVHVRMP
jgi:hypothetical protein